MDKIEWCIRKKEGLRLIEPNSNLAGAYIKKSEEALQSMNANIPKDWKISTAYYTTYFALYALLMRIGIECEIHSCTIEFARQFLKEYFSKEEIEFVEESLKARINSQYYVNRTVPDPKYQDMIKLAPRFMVKCKSILNQLNEKTIKEIRENFQKRVK